MWDNSSVFKLDRDNKMNIQEYEIIEALKEKLNRIESQLKAMGVEL